MNGGLSANARLLEAIAPATAGVDVAVFVPFPYLAQCEASLRGTGVKWGAQDVSEHASGAYTGEVSGRMLRDFGCEFVLVGHSERRSYHGESSELVVRKAVAAHRAGVVPVVCVGETLAEREAGQTEQVVAGQIDALLRGADPDVWARCVVAYEPVWAIGTGRHASPDQAQAVHAFIRGRIAETNMRVSASLPIIYGGSVKGANAASLFEMPDVDGGLVGGASLDAGEFMEICRAAAAVGAHC